MKKILVIFFLFILATDFFAQITIINQDSAVVNQPPGLDKIIIFSQIEKSTPPRIDANIEAGDKVEWYKFINNDTIFERNTKQLYPENNTGYLLKINDKEIIKFWVFDYSQYAPQLNSLTVDNASSDCDNVTLKLDGNIPKFEYQTPTGGIYTLKRDFKVTYNNVEWQDNKWVKKTEEVLVEPPFSTIIVSSPYSNTAFTFLGDQFVAPLGLAEFAITSGTYITKSVKGQITSITTTRENVKNENDRPMKETQLEGSAPLYVQFLSNPTENVQSYNWVVKRNGQTIMTRAVKDHNYTFSEAGNYKVYLTVANAGNPLCTDSSSVDVKIFESQIAVPKIFTPDGDGKNEEFKVAFRSIIEFKATILNRWGRTVYSWTDPTKGWDGTNNGKPVSEGTYFYVINAKGSDDRIYNLKGYLTLLRWKN